MSEIIPTFESIFARDYWGDVHRMKEAEKRSRIPHEVHMQMRQLAAQAATSIFEGAPRKRLPEGTEINHSGDSFHTLPGTVLLTDYEVLFPPKKSQLMDLQGEEGLPFHRQGLIHDEEDLSASPAYLFRRNSKEVLDVDGQPQTTVYPYLKGVFNTELNSAYGRGVFLTAFGVDKKNSVDSRPILDWETPDDSLIGLAGSWRNLLLRFPPATVGETYRYKGERFFLRLRSAEICLSGMIEYAKARKKARRSFLVGRTATSAT